MLPSTVTVLSSMLTLVAAAPSNILSRNPSSDPMLLTWWDNGCAQPNPSDGPGNSNTYVFSSEGPSYPGDCVATPSYNWQSVKLQQDSDASYSVELFSGEGCNNPILTVTQDGCYTQPEGAIVLSARANLK
ncbi:uncharacterized protein RCC_11001 [Ramularia collo-cygni]|uniref:AA1-like domain-containing protein n=1 Tax=Ramularia collo-cygni TaxID=112498 RepID=A0A2D3VB19_9PEZI|nr:uncharacterized protein RCC_11001 [Ramularia collo-cygni]CZT25273.1 uncharacterized protein RCC_11001 [Ramularia collo-cygni]